jgi:nucleoside-diphosphate-sugar epimerase
MAEAKSHIAVTGSTGFVGSYLEAFLKKQDCIVTPISRSILNDEAALKLAIEPCSAVIHCAGLAHRLGSHCPSYDAYFAANVQTTQTLLKASEASSDQHILILSSLNIFMTDETKGRIALTSPRVPADPYGQTKLEAMLYAQKWANTHQRRVDVVIPPLIYGPYVKGNLKSLLKLLTRHMPLPVGLSHHPRSFVSLNALSRFFLHLVQSNRNDPLRPRFYQEYLVKDAHDISLKCLITKLKSLCDSHSPLLPVPAMIGHPMLSALGKKRLANQLFSELTVDDSSMRATGFMPQNMSDDDLHSMVQTFIF